MFLEDLLEEPGILILLATYHGERFLGEFLDGVCRQSYRDWRMLVRDDGSSDTTCAIIDERSRTDSRISRIRDDRGRLGPAGNFGRLMDLATDREEALVALADQDDVWLPGKLESQLQHMRQWERETDAGTPILVHTDLTVTNARLSVLHPSMHGMTRSRGEATGGLHSFLLHNSVTGCACLVNRPLLQLATPVPAEVVMHDWWLALCAAACGRIGYVPESTVLYRQHGDNVVGGRSLWRTAWQRLQELIRERSSMNEQFLRCLEQLAAFRRRLEERDHVPAKSLELVERVCELFDGSVNSRVGRVRRLMVLGVPNVPVFRRLSTYARAFAFKAVPTSSGETAALPSEESVRRAA